MSCGYKIYFLTTQILVCSIIDYVVTNRAVPDMRSVTSVNIRSDHNLVLCIVRMTLRNKQNERMLQFRINLELKYEYESNQDLHTTRLKEKINDNPIEDDNVVTSWSKVKTKSCCINVRLQEDKCE